MKLETLNCANYSTLNQRKKFKKCLPYLETGIVCCACGHFLRKGREENQKFAQYTMDLLSFLNYYDKKGRPHGHHYGKKPGDTQHYVAHSLKKKCTKKDFLGIHGGFIRDEKFRMNMIPSEETDDYWIQQCQSRTDLIANKRQHCLHFDS